jgi:hypothetical protein
MSQATAISKPNKVFDESAAQSSVTISNQHILEIESIAFYSQLLNGKYVCTLTASRIYNSLRFMFLSIVIASPAKQVTRSKCR